MSNTPIKEQQSVNGTGVKNDSNSTLTPETGSANSPANTEPPETTTTTTTVTTTTVTSTAKPKPVVKESDPAGDKPGNGLGNPYGG